MLALNSQCNQGWPWTLDPPVPTSCARITGKYWVLGFSSALPPCQASILPTELPPQSKGTTKHRSLWVLLSPLEWLPVTFRINVQQGFALSAFYPVPPALSVISLTLFHDLSPVPTHTPGKSSKMWERGTWTVITGNYQLFRHSTDLP